MRTKLLAPLAAAAACLMAVTVGIAPAQADPVGPPQFRQLAGVGSDTTQDVDNGLAQAITIGGEKVLGSYDATGSAQIQTKAAANCTINRPNGSSAGRTALLNQLQAGNGCLQFSRSSSLNQNPAAVQLTYIPFAVDAVTFATAGTTTVPKRLTLAQLQSVYRCQVPSIKPYIPQAGSGTRAFWLSQMGITEAQLPTFSCVSDTKNGQPIQEHDGRILTAPNEVVPFSIAQYISQQSAVIPDVRGSAELGVLDGKSAFVLNADSTSRRDVYHVIPTSQEGVAPTSTVFVGSNSLVCQQAAVIRQYGFATTPNCGDTTLKTQ